MSSRKEELRKTLEKSIEKAKETKLGFISEQKYEKAAEWRDKERKLREQLQALDY